LNTPVSGVGTTIVGGARRYLGAIGAMAAGPSTDLLLWTKTIEIAAPSDRSGEGTRPYP